MKKRVQTRFFAWLLVLLCVLQPLVIEVAHAESNTALQTIKTQQDAFNEAYQEIMNIKPVEIDWLLSKTLCGADSANGQAWGTYEAKIKEANKSIADAKAQAQQAKSLLDLQAIQAQTLATENDGVKSDLVGTVKAKAQLQDGLRTAGEQIKNVGMMMSCISQILGVAYIVMAAIGAVTTFGIVTALVTPLSIASTVLGIVGGGLTAAGDSLVASSQAGANTDDAVLVAIGCGVATGVVEGAFSKYGVKIDAGVSSILGKGIGKLVGKEMNLAPTLSGNIFKYIISRSRAYDAVAARAANAAGREVAPDGVKTVYDAAAVGVANQARQGALKDATTGTTGKILGQLGGTASVSSTISVNVKNQINTNIPNVIKSQPGISVP